jgi:preprotein translocase subunit YajC
MLDLFIGTAWAQSGAPSPGGQGFQMLVMFGLIFGIMYFLMIRPQNKRMQEHAAMVAALKKGDQLVTAGGLHGRIHAVEEKSIVLEVAKGVRITVDNDKIARMAGLTAAASDTK